MARWIESWLPGTPTDNDHPPGHPGERFGLPAEGVNSVAGTLRRIGGVCIDWLLCYVLVLAVVGGGAVGAPSTGWYILGLWYLMTAVTVAILGMTPGHVVLGMRVARTDMAQFVGVPRALLRTAMIAVVLPPLFRDTDGRGWHDRASTTIVVRTR